jgi:ABC-2 type transport system ATP-binding protein
VIDSGKVIARGTADDLKLRVGGEVLALRVTDRAKVPAAAGSVLGLGPGGGKVDNNTGELTIPVGGDGPRLLTEAVRRLDAEGIELADISLRRPTLDDVFLSLTGHAAEETAGDGEVQTTAKRRSRRRREEGAG